MVKMDFPELTRKYQAEGLLYRLLHVAETGPSTAGAAIQQVLTAAKAENRFHFYSAACRLAEKFSVGVLEDSLSAQALKDWEAAMRSILIQHESAIAQAKNSVDKDLIREAIKALGDYHYHSGDPSGALKSYIRNKDFLLTHDQIFFHSIVMAKSAFFHKNYPYAINQANKALNLPTASTRHKNIARALAGLCCLRNKDYRYAANHLCTVTAALQGELGDLVALEDIPVYTILVSLCVFDREEMKTNVLLNKELANLIEENAYLTELLESYANCDFPLLIGRVSELSSALAQDYVIGPCISDIYFQIQNRLLAEYLRPFKRIQIESIATTFGMTMNDMEQRLATLIMDQKVQGRIDSYHKWFQAKYSDEKLQSFEETLAGGRRQLRNTEIILLRANIIQQKLVLKASRTKHEP